MTITGMGGASGAEPPDTDPYLWLEDVSGRDSLDWVRAQNARSQEVLEADKDFERLEKDLLSILDSDEKIPYVVKRGPHYYNFWTDRDHQRGLWRRTTPAEYRKPDPEWETLLDIDALNEAEGENWVWHGADCLKPADPERAWKRCLIALSRGGADADVTREFDLVTKDWVRDGFYRPEAKGSLGWIDRDTVFVSTDFGEGSLTESGYPRIVKEWKRGTPMAQAALLYEGKHDDLSVGATHDDTTGYERDFVYRSIAFYNYELYLREPNGELSRIEAPNSANKSVYRDWLMLELREPWTVGGRTWPAGSLLAARFEDFMAGERNFDVLFEPTSTTSLAGFSWTRHHLLLNVLDNVKNRISVLTPRDDEWSTSPLAGTPQIGSVSAWPVDDEESDDYFLQVTDFLTPTTLYFGSVGKAPEKLKSLPAFFDVSGLTITQHFATSKDGTRVPYFLVAAGEAGNTGDNPALLYGYGGFEISLTPAYSASVGRGWLTQGGVYAVANIRGGGEFGPRWHQAALKADRHKAYEDFAAVAADMISKKITRPDRLGIQGGSNGGLLVGNMLTEYPQMFGAVVCQVPLLDMRRYHRLLAGASWMAEYGDPDKPEEWAYIRKFSPYHNVSKDVTYPPVLFMTSTRDDRVHPAHARKMTVRMLEQGHDVLYYENIEGGHGGAADNRQQAYMQALAYTFLKQQLIYRLVL
jgi:prolyl oligopeptidase